MRREVSEFVYACLVCQKANLTCHTQIFIRLEGKVALISGGASGIGEATARLFSKHGAHVVIADIQDDLGLSLCKHLESASYVHCDVTNENDVQNAVNTAISKYGNLDIMFNNAGIIDEIKTSILDNSKFDFERVISVNLVGPFLGTKHAARVMIAALRWRQLSKKLTLLGDT